jgi:phage tail-like protein
MATKIQRWSTHSTDPLRGFRFQAEFQASSNSGTVFTDKITGFSGGFNSITGLTITTQNIAYREGGYNTTTHQIPGMTSFQPIAFQKGALFGSDNAIEWMRGLFAASAGDGLSTVGKDFRCNVTIYLMDHPDTNPSDIATAKMGFRIHNAWIQQLSYSDLNAGDNALLFETMTLVHEGLTIFHVDAAKATTTRDPVSTGPKGL